MNFSPIKRNREVLVNTSPSLRYADGEDFAAWQVKAKDKLIELIGLDDFVKCDSEFEILGTETGDSFTATTFKMKSEKEYSFTSTLYIPLGKEGKLPLAICLFGHSDDLAVALDGEAGRDICMQALSRGYCALALEQRDFDNCFASKDIILPEAPTRTTWCACYRSSMRAILMGRTTIAERVWDVMRAIDAVSANFDKVDTDNICIIGNSGNATAAYYAACIDERIGSVIASSGVATWESSLAKHSHCICNYIPNVVPYFDMGDIGGLIAPRKLVLQGAEGDEWFPVSGLKEAYALIERAYAAAGKPDACKLQIFEGDAYLRADEAWDAVVKA